MPELACGASSTQAVRRRSRTAPPRYSACRLQAGILPAIVRLNEAEAFGRVESRDGARGHDGPFWNDLDEAAVSTADGKRLCSVCRRILPGANDAYPGRIAAIRSRNPKATFRFPEPLQYSRVCDPDSSRSGRDYLDGGISAWSFAWRAERPACRRARKSLPPWQCRWPWRWLQFLQSYNVELRFIRPGQQRLQAAVDGVGDDEIARLKSKVGEIARANELLYANIGKLDAGRPMARGRSRR